MKDRVNGAISALNSLYGVESRPGAPCSAGQRRAIASIQSSVQRLGTPPPEYSGTPKSNDGALKELLKGSRVYEPAPSTSVSFVSDRVAWPSCSSPPVDIRRLVRERDQAWLGDWQSNMLRDPQDVRRLVEHACPRGPYCDPALHRDDRTHGQLLLQTYERQMVSFCQDGGASYRRALLRSQEEQGAPDHIRHKDRDLNLC